MESFIDYFVPDYFFKDSGAYLESRVAGLRKVTVRGSGGRTVDLSNYKWAYQVDLSLNVCVYKINMYVCMHVRMHACMHVFMYVCLYIFVLSVFCIYLLFSLSFFTCIFVYYNQCI